MRKEIPLLIVFVTGLIYVLAAFFSIPIATSAKTLLDRWYNIALAFAVLLGVINLTLLHLRSIGQRKAGWGFSMLLMVCMYATAIIGIVQSESGDFFSTIIFNGMLLPLQGTMFSFLVFYITSAAYRAFRARSFEATVLLLTGVIVMLGRAPIGNVISPLLPTVSTWLLNIPTTAGQRGIIIGAALGAVATALRVMLGIERSYLGAE